MKHHTLPTWIQIFFVGGLQSAFATQGPTGLSPHLGQLCSLFSQALALHCLWRFLGSKIKLDDFSKLRMKCKNKWLKLPTKSRFGVRFFKGPQRNQRYGQRKVVVMWGRRGKNQSLPISSRPSAVISGWILWFLTPSHLSCLKKNPFRSPKITGISPHPAVHPAPTIQTL